MDMFKRFNHFARPFYRYVPPYFRDMIIYPYLTYCTKPLKTPKPKVLVMELSNICNLNCKMCTRPAKAAPKGSMDLDMAKSVIQKAHDCGIERLGFHTVGEPLLYPHLCEVLVFAKKFGFPVGISANANLLTPKKTEMLMNIGIDSLRVSLEGTDSTYDFIRQGGNFLKVIDNIEYFRNRRNRNMYPKITCNYVLTKDSIKCVNDFMSNYAKLFDEVTFCTMINQGYMQNSYVQDRSIILFKNNNYPCFNLWNNMYVTFNGDVSVCCVDYNHKLIVGNVKTDTLLDIWNSKAYQRYRKLHKQGRINEMEFCRNCTMPVLGSSFQMSKVGELVRRRYGLNIKILNRY